MHVRPRLRHFIAHRVAVWLLLLALGLAPLLGQVHRTLHGGGAAPVAGLTEGLTGAVTVAVTGAAHGAHGLDSLFGNHESAGDCRLYDQLGHADGGPCVPVLALPVLVPLFFIAFLQGEAVARFAALFDARGPPSLR